MNNKDIIKEKSFIKNNQSKIIIEYFILIIMIKENATLGSRQISYARARNCPLFMAVRVSERKNTLAYYSATHHTINVCD